jgi:tyrosine-protein phosphatase SIW14
MPRWPLKFLGVVLAVAVLVAPLALAVHQQRSVRNFHVVREGVLYRSRQPTVEGLRRLIHDHGIRTVVCLRDAVPGRPQPDPAEQEYCEANGITFIVIPPRPWETTDGSATADEGVRRFLEVVADPSNHPVLIHCFAGIHRTGAYCAAFRMEFDGWSNEQAIAEVKAYGYTNLDNEWDILGYLERYRPGERLEARPRRK